jgi:hypothetical protein
MSRRLCRVALAMTFVGLAAACSDDTEPAGTTTISVEDDADESASEQISDEWEPLLLEPSETYLMPVSAGPRAGGLGLSFEAMTTTAVTFETDPAAAAALLPPGFEPADPPLVSVSHSEYEGAEMAGGLDHNTVRVEISAIQRNGGTATAGQFVVVLWDSSFMSTVLGRELMGWPVLRDDVPDAWSDGVSRGFSVSEFGNVFLEAVVTELVPLDTSELAAIEQRANGEP